MNRIKKTIKSQSLQTILLSRCLLSVEVRIHFFFGWPILHILTLFPSRNACVRPSVLKKSQNCVKFVIDLQMTTFACLIAIDNLFWTIVIDTFCKHHCRLLCGYALLHKTFFVCLIRTGFLYAIFHK